MPIPPFDHNNVLPPHLGDPRESAGLSPFPATSVEVCQRFATSPERRAILSGWLAFRRELTSLGVIRGFQWLDGSFLEDKEAALGKPPEDLDLITFFMLPTGEAPALFQSRIFTALPAFFDRDISKADFLLDHFPVHLGAPGPALVENTRYWTGLFSHNRDGIWKGMLRIELNTAVEDTAAAQHLATFTP